MGEPCNCTKEREIGAMSEKLCAIHEDVRKIDGRLDSIIPQVTATEVKGDGHSLQIETHSKQIMMVWSMITLLISTLISFAIKIFS